IRIVGVDTNNHRFGGTQADVTAWRDTKRNLLQTQLDAYWHEASFNVVGAEVEMRDEVFQLPGAFADYFNRDYNEASVTTAGLAGKAFPLTLGGVSAVLHVHDLHGRNDDVTWAPSGPFATLNALVAKCQTTFDATRPNWVACRASGGEIVIALVQAE